MGLNFSHCEAQWSYSGFHCFRKRLAKEVGIDLDEMQGFRRKPPEGEGGRTGGFEGMMERIAKVGKEQWLKEETERFEATLGVPGTRPWDGVKDPIKALLRHSDCEGHLTPVQCKKIAPRLEELVAKWPDEMELTPGPALVAIGYKPKMRIMEHDKQNALLLARGMRDAAKKRERLRFC